LAGTVTAMIVGSSTLPGPECDRLVGRAKTLSWLSLAYVTAEGAIAIAAAILSSSVALLGFGLDSAIEGLASIIVVWRFTGARRFSEHAEQRAQRLVAITFFLLTPYITQDAIRTLINGEQPRTSCLGIGLSIASIIICHSSEKPSKRSASAWAQARPLARAVKACSAPTSQRVSSPA
jgi:divalent metal cation (Fe/Co/Zn/Cd) transporter